MQIAIVVYPGMTALDAVGPYEVLRFVPGAEIRFVSRKPGRLVTDSKVLVLEATHSYEDTPSPDIVLVPGSEADTTTAMADSTLIEWLKQVHETSQWTASVCSGALVLAAAGLLEGRPATTHWIAQGSLERLGAKAQRSERIVRSGKIVTAAGVSAGIDLALWLVEETSGRRRAEIIQLLVEYDPSPPVDAGHPDKASPEVYRAARAEMRRRMKNPRNIISVPRLLCRRGIRAVRRAFCPDDILDQGPADDRPFARCPPPGISRTSGRGLANGAEVLAPGRHPLRPNWIPCSVKAVRRPAMRQFLTSWSLDSHPAPIRFRGRSASVLLAVVVAATIVPGGWGAAQDLPDRPPWSVPASWDVEETDVAVESDGVRLAGTLFSPVGIQDGPAVVAVQQAGTETRDNVLFRQIAETFNAIGVSVMLYDRRGHGESEGDPARPSYQTLAADAVAAKRAIARMDQVHPKRIGFWGLSQGGWLAMEAGAMSDAAFVISVAAPLTTPGEQMEFLAYNYTLLDGHGETAAREALQLRRAVAGEYYRGERSYASARSMLAEAQEEPWFERTFLPGPDELPEDPESSSWIHEMAYDPTSAFGKVRGPLLFILGGEDFDVPVERTLAIAEEFEDRDNREIVVIPGASHVMRVEADPRDQFELEPDDASNSVIYFLVMGEWLGRLGLTF